MKRRKLTAEQIDLLNAYQAVKNEYGHQWMTEESLTKWLGIQSIKARLVQGKLTVRQIQFWADKAA